MQVDTERNVNELDARIQAVNNRLSECITRKCVIADEVALEQFEREIRLIFNELGDLITAQKIQQQIDTNEEFRDQCTQFARSFKSLVNKGRVVVWVRFSGGTQLPIHATYWSRKRAAGKRGKGLYPELYFLGIHDHCSPFLVSEVAKAATALCSFEEARHMLETRGCPLDIKTIRRITKHFAARARAGQKAEDVVEILRSENLQGRKIVISTDGGRLRIRRPKQGKRTRKNRSRYQTDWREPKLLIIYVVNDTGRVDKKVLPLVDGTLKGPEALFGLLYCYLYTIDLSSVKQMLFVADGAAWIWKSVRLVRAMLKMSGLECKIFELIDFYHAVQHLHEFAKHKGKWSAKQRKQWVSRQKKLLKGGQAEQVIANMKAVTTGSKSKVLRRELEYFVKNKTRLSYNELSALGMPIGSGAIESAVRRIINLRLKSPCIFWNEDTAEEMLFLRAYYKSGRWGLLKKMAYCGGLRNAA